MYIYLIFVDEGKVNVGLWPTFRPNLLMFVYK